MNKIKEITEINISELKPNPKNRNKHPKDQIQRLAEIIKYQGFRHPVIVSKRSGFIVSGHGRLEAAKLLGLEKVPVSYQDFDSDDQEFAAQISDNAIASWAELDLGGINDDLKDLDGLNFDLDLLGLKDFEIEILPSEKNVDGVPALPLEAKSKLGDLWTLGTHRLMCGDSTNIQHVERLMDGKKADMVFTDPPYNIDFKPQRGTHERILNDSMDEGKFTDWLGSVFTCADTVTKSDTYAFVWSSWSTIDQFAPVLRRLYEVKALHVWVKNNFGIGYYSRPKYEPFFLCLKGKPPMPEIAPADVWDHTKVYSTVHSCEKPVGLTVRILQTYGARGLILDLFGGSGSTLIACEETNRKCFMMELDPKYCDVIVARWAKLTGKDPVRDDGVKWSELK